MSDTSASSGNGFGAGELECYRRRCAEIEAENTELKAKNAEFQDRMAKLESENRELREELLALKTTVIAVVARSIDAKASLDRKRYKKSGRRVGHQGASRSRPDRIDEAIELYQSTCPRCGGVLWGNHTDSYTRIVEDIVPARIVVTDYVVKRTYCRGCRRQVSPPIPNVINGGSNERFGVRLMLFIVSLKLLGLSYEKISAHLKLLFNPDLTEAAMFHCVMTAAVQAVLSKQPKIGMDALVHSSIPVVVEQKLDRGVLGFSGHLNVDAFSFESIVLDLKNGLERDFHRLSATGYAFACESILEYPVNICCIVYMKLTPDLPVPSVKRVPFLIDESLRQEFLDLRDEKTRMVVEGRDPRIPSRCPPNCLHIEHCRGEGQGATGS